jgi:hypothetical protein
MRRTVCLLFCLFNLSVLGICQSDKLSDFNAQRLQKQKTGMLVLGSWALGNIALSSAMLSGAKGPDKGFHQMQIGWNVVNLGIAGLGYFSALKTDPASFDLYQSIQEQHKLQKILLFNAGLDVGYVLGGAYLLERGQRVVNNAERLRGFGRSIMLQGGFLLVFDLAQFAVLSSDNAEIKTLLQQSGLQLGLNGVGLNLRF